jgi:tetratricopeptide (TPR) repeat protein
MSRSARLWKGVGPWAIGGMLLSGALVRAADPPPLSQQLLDLGRQAHAQGREAEARTFFEKALSLDPNNVEAKKALQDRSIRRVSLTQDPKDDATDKPAPPADSPAPEKPKAAPASLEQVAQQERVAEQRLDSYVADRLARARELLNANQPAEALTLLRLLLESIRAEQVGENQKARLSREVGAQIQLTVRREERIEQNRAEQLRVAAQSAQTARAVAELNKNQEVANTLMTQFDQLMNEGQYNVLYNGGSGDIAATVAPFYSARIIAQQARAVDPTNTAPHLGVYLAEYEGFYAQEIAYEKLKEYRYMMTLQDAGRASIPHPDSLVIEYPPADFFRAITEKRIKRYESVSLDSRDEKTMAIIHKLDQPVSMPFQQETPLEEVIKYIKSATISPQLPDGIPIYVDPVGLQEAEKQMSSPVTLSLEGVPLKRSLKLLLKQLELTYTVKEGLMTITHISSKDQPTEIRVYPVADLAIIPFSLMGGGGMGGMGGGMGGMGGGMGGGMMGGMGGGGMMGGMGGGMGGMGGGMGGGMMSVPPAPPQDRAGQTDDFVQKKSR